MSASSGIGVAPDLVDLFADANVTDGIRFIKVSIKNESLVHDQSIPVSGSFEHDLMYIHGSEALEDNVPAYILAKLAPSEWLIIYYVPDSAKVRDKMLYASSRTSLLKSLGSTIFTDSIFATSKADLSPEAYASHKRHIAAPKPLSAREQVMADIRAAESGGAYEGSRTRANHLGTGVGLRWSHDVEQAVKSLGTGESSAIVLIKIDQNNETLVLESTSEITVESLGSSLPPSEPCYVFFAWQHAHSSPPRREIIFIYSCPSGSPIKYRMVYSSGAASVFLGVKSLLSDVLSATNIHLAFRKIETSDPAELDEAYLKYELGLESGEGTAVAGEQRNRSELSKDMDEKKPFAKPKGPGRRR